MSKLFELSKKEWLKRCEMVYDHPITKNIDLSLLQRTYDAVMRLEGGQADCFFEFMYSEMKRTGRFDYRATLANDAQGYANTYALSILNHHCQKCAEDIEAWHTRSGFCLHNKKNLGVGNIKRPKGIK